MGGGRRVVVGGRLSVGGVRLSMGGRDFPPPFPHTRRTPSPLEGEGWGEGADEQRFVARLHLRFGRRRRVGPLSLSLPLQGGGDAVGRFGAKWRLGAVPV
ncbi:hypothetical protein GCM10007904_25620 [Oharaeibacter diazotrophicus]|nr:hypothetical protein GCM10007904_25620 [Oharaeibacter diazotrophicus]